MIKHLDISVEGEVQGVFYRAYTKEHAEQLNIAGFARNEPDGTVYIEAEGGEEDLQEFLIRCKLGPSSADVVGISSKEGPLRNFPNFEINK